MEAVTLGLRVGSTVVLGCPEALLLWEGEVELEGAPLEEALAVPAREAVARVEAVREAVEEAVAEGGVEGLSEALTLALALVEGL